MDVLRWFEAIYLAPLQTMSEQANDDMSFLQHLEVLRWHLVRSFLVILVFSILAFVFKSFVFDTIIFAPKNGDFPTFIFLCKVSAKLHVLLPALFAADSICIGQDLPTLQNISMAGQFTTHIMVSLIAGFIVAFPYVVYELWRFVSPGLKCGERKFAFGIVGATSFLFLSGVLFGYFIISPLSVNFFLTYSISESVQTIPTLSTYISTVTTVVLACGFVFQLPNLIYFLARGGIVNAKALKAFRRHALVAALVLSAVITPPDVFSQLLVSLPLLVLYEVSIFIARRVEKNREARP